MRISKATCKKIFFELIDKHFKQNNSINQGFPKWTKTDTQGATSIKGARGGLWAVMKPTYTRYAGVADEELKKVLGVFNGSFLSKLVGGIAFLISFK